MPSNWLSIDNGFPTLNESESPQKQILALHNYLFQLREGLQYSLQNLTTDNFNTKVWENVQKEQKDEITSQVQKVINAVSQLSNEVIGLRSRIAEAEDAARKLGGRVDSLEVRVADNEEALEELGVWMAIVDGEQEQTSEKVSGLDSELNGEGGIANRLGELATAVEKLSSVLAVTADGSTTMGTQGKDLHLVGNLYINGVAFTQGETT